VKGHIRGLSVKPPVRGVGNFRNLNRVIFPTHKSILPQSSADFKKIISDQRIECRSKTSWFMNACRVGNQGSKQVIISISSRSLDVPSRTAGRNAAEQENQQCLKHIGCIVLLLNAL